MPSAWHSCRPTLACPAHTHCGSRIPRVAESTPRHRRNPTHRPGQAATNGVGGVYWNTSSTDSIYIEPIAPGTATLQYTFTGMGVASGTVSRASLKLTAVNAGLVPDYDRDRMIDWRDRQQASTNRLFRWWINDDADNGDIASGDCDLPGEPGGQSGEANHADEVVNGRCDLLDFFPVWLDLGGLFTVFPTPGNHTLRMSQEDSAVRMVYTDLSAPNAGSYLVSAVTNCGPDFAQAAHRADTFLVDKDGVNLSQAFVDKIIADPEKGILIVEGCAGTQKPLVLDVLWNDVHIARAELPLSISGVEEMFRFHNIRFEPDIPQRTGEPGNLPDSELKNIDIFLAHGFLVSENESRAWGAGFSSVSGRKAAMRASIL